ncbi:MAG: hypothetical protein V2J55_19135 [Candidatus Competibacteraceae bacterium]|jgi:hypothetical protein|nr:hypothetical protein [Candidatus Competibacteraceae bacterium]
MGELFLQSFAFYGLAIIISLLVAVLIRGIVAVLALTSEKPIPPPAVAPPRPAEFPAGDIAAIAAAVYAVMGAHRVVHIERGRRGLVWTAEGRVSHHTSHNVSRRSRR